MDALATVVHLSQTGIYAVTNEIYNLIFDGNTRHLGLQATLLAAATDDLIVEEWDVAKLASKAILAVVELAVDNNADGHTTTHMGR